MVRNPGKFGKAKRGGGRHFSRDLSRLDSDGNSEKGKGSGEESSSEESSSEEEIDPRQRVGQLPPIGGDSDSENEGGGNNGGGGRYGNNNGLMANLNSTLSTVALEPPEEGPSTSNSRLGGKSADQVAQARKERRAAQGSKKPTAGNNKKVNGSGSESEAAEENENTGKKTMMKLSDLSAPREMSRREKEQAEKIAAKERYAKLHAAGKTDEARSDLGRLAEIRKQRELAAAQRKAEAEAKEVAGKAALEKSGKKFEKPTAGARVPLKR